MYAPTQKEYNVAKQQTRILHALIYLLNYKMQIVDELSGVVIESSFTNSASSNLRRSCSISLYPSDKSFDIANGNKIWIDKYIKVYIGIEDELTGEIVYTNMGVYLINNPQRSYSATTNILTLSGLDLMSKMTGLRNGNLNGIPYVIPVDTNVRTAIIGVIALAGFTNYYCEECTYPVVNEIKVDIGGTVYDILEKLRTIVPQYQMYFDVDGVFHYEMIPSGTNEQVLADDDIWKATMTSCQINTDFESIKNKIIVIGKTHDIKNYASTTTISGSTYVMSIASVTSLRNNLKIGFTAPNAVTNPYINLNSYGAKPLKNLDGTFPTLSSSPNVYYVAKYKTDGAYFLFMGEVTPKAEISETNPLSPFYVNGTAGIIQETLSGGDYDNIYMSTLALARAKWELYNKCRMQDSITLNCAPIYWLDVNRIISITLPNKQGTETTDKYIIKQINISGGVDGMQTITAMRYYPYYETE